MCSTCNYKNYTETEKTFNGKSIVFLKDDKSTLDIHCDITGQNYKIGDFTIYYCPTCGKKLF